MIDKLGKTAVVHVKKQAFDVYIGRPSRWGNPFKIGRDGNREEVLARYRAWLQGDSQEATWVRQHVGQLRGKRLGCWCAPLACHGDVLAELAEEEQ